MIVVTALLVGLLALALFVAARELVGFHPDPEWQDVGKLRERFAAPMPKPPHRLVATRYERVQFCLDARKEFLSAWLLCRFLAPVTGDASYLGKLFATKLRFDATVLVAICSAAIGARELNERATMRMSQIGKGMRQAALAVLGDSEVDRCFAAG
ncbi:MAG: hypothetical protein R2748_22200 [Bryobacterales bacterium]